MSKSNPTAKKVSYRKINSIDYEQFKSDLHASELLWNIQSQLDDLVNTYNTTLSALVDKHAPLRTRSVVHKTRVPWFRDEIRSMRRLRRQSERKWRRTKLDSDRQAFKALWNRTMHVLYMVRREFYSDFVHKMSGDPRKLFAITKKMLNLVKESPFPEHCNRLTLANELGAFFKMKISNTRSELDAAATVHNNHSTLAPSANFFQPSSSFGFFSNFELLSKDNLVLSTELTM